MLLRFCVVGLMRVAANESRQAFLIRTSILLLSWFGLTLLLVYRLNPLNLRPVFADYEPLSVR